MNPQPPRKSSNATYLIIIVAIISGFGLFYMQQAGSAASDRIKTNVTGKPAIETPRTTAPMETLTPYFDKRTLTHNGREYTYYWHAPATPWPEGLRFPLVLVLHGSPGRAYAAKYLIAGDMPQRYPAFVLAPVMSQQRPWARPPRSEHNPTDELNEFYGLHAAIAMVRDAMARYPVDPQRIYVIGCSDGGTGAFGAVRYYPGLFAAAVPISGNWNPEDGVNMTRTPMLILHGRHDNVLPAAPIAALAAIIKSRGGPAHYYEFPDMAHSCPSDRFYEQRVWQWLFAQKRAGT